MDAAVEQDPIPFAIPLDEHLEDAARLLEQALKVGPADASIAYLLALCRKRQGKTGEARTALRKIAQPDANVWLQLGLLSFAEKQFAQAEEEFARAALLDPTSYEAAFNLLLTRLCLGQTDACTASIAAMLPLAPDPDERRFLSLLETLLRSSLAPRRTGPPPVPGSPAANGSAHATLGLGSITTAEAERLLRMLSGLGNFDVMYPLLRVLAVSLPSSQTVQDAYLEVVLVQARKLADRCEWFQADQLLAPQVTGAAPRSAHQVALLNLLGCCAAMLQDYERAVNCFSSALRGSGNDPWLHQNLALTYEFQGRLDQADRHWTRYFDLLDRISPAPPLPSQGSDPLQVEGQTEYRKALAFEGLSRLADLHSKKERWQIALGYLQRASELRAADVDTLERLFHLYNQLRRPEDARRTLRRLRELKPNDPQFDLYELDVRETRTLEDLERMLSDIRRILAKHPNDMRVEERALGMVTNFIPLMTRMLDQFGQQLNKIVDQVRRLPSYQINWPAVHDVIRDLLHQFQKLRRAVGKCLGMVSSEEQKRVLRDLSEQIERRIEVCQSMER